MITPSANCSAACTSDPALYPTTRPPGAAPASSAGASPEGTSPAPSCGASGADSATCPEAAPLATAGGALRCPPHIAAGRSGIEVLHCLLRRLYVAADGRTQLAPAESLTARVKDRLPPRAPAGELLDDQEFDYILQRGPVPPAADGEMQIGKNPVPRAVCQPPGRQRGRFTIDLQVRLRIPVRLVPLIVDMAEQ